MMERDFYYLLPDGITMADNMKEGCEILSKQRGYNFGTHSFRLYVKNGIIKKINRNINSITLESDADSNSSEGNASTR
jgi:hypothetical protein